MKQSSGITHLAGLRLIIAGYTITERPISELTVIRMDEIGKDDQGGRIDAAQHSTQDLELFAEGQPIDPKYLFLLYPARDAVWEIRSVRDAPSIRVLGLFAAKDVFIATNHALRETLGGWESREWKVVKRAARACWNRLFGTYQPLTSTNVRDLVSGAIDGKYFKN